jgi:hypothetical protein
MLSHYDIGAVLENHVEQQILYGVGYLQRKFSLCFAERYWAPINSEMCMFGENYSDASDHLIWALTKDTDDEINAALEPFFRLLIRSGPNLILEAALPFLAGLTNLLSVDYFFPVWPFQRGLQGGNSEEFYKDNPDVAELHSEPVPETRDELMNYEYWPPCMRAMVSQCKGAQHLKYHQRVRMAAQVRKFQYSPEQGAQLWTTIFSETDVYAAHGNLFLASKQGKIVVEDYARGKVTNIGASCEAWIANGFCPLGKTGIAKDIEDIKVKCTDGFNNVHPRNHFLGVVQSPSDYFRMARKVLPRTRKSQVSDD